ncbi:MAG: phosphoglucosamine mutase [Microthrixaceae bacterium]
MRFGTDGIRGAANTALTPELALAIGRATARTLGGPRIAVGRDTRRSGEMLEAAFASGVMSEGVDVELLGVVPTPVVAHRSAAAGHGAAMMSASHNPAADNGIKVFAAGGLKLADDVEGRLEAELDRLSGSGADETAGRPGGVDVGITHRIDAVDAYLRHVVAALEGRHLGGLSVVLDVANGAAVATAERVFSSLGASVHVVHSDPDGTNINDRCGSTHPESLVAEVVRSGADCGFAYDGDADRVLAVDRDGRVIDGDQLMGLLARDLLARGRLAGGRIALTVMSNLGLRLGLADAGIGIVETAVGDRYVLEAMDRESLSLGGEQSGHIILRDLATTGDGVLSSLMVADVMVRVGRPLDELADAAMQRLPQVLRNVEISSPIPDVADRVRSAIAAAEAAMGERGRVLVRPSGTEPVVRVMVEATDADTARHWTDVIAAEVDAL